MTGDESAKKVMIDASESLVDRFSDKAGCIRSWDGDELGFMGRGYSRSNMNSHYFVIIDNMVSLSLLLLAKKGDGEWSDTEPQDELGYAVRSYQTYLQPPVCRHRNTASNEKRHNTRPT